MDIETALQNAVGSSTGLVGIVWAIAWVVRPIATRWFEEQIKVSEAQRQFQLDTVKNNSLQLEVTRQNLDKLSALEEGMQELLNRACIPSGK